MGVAWISLLALPAALCPWGGLFLILGNRFPCFHGFRGGKGVANYLGFTLILAPISAICSAVAWCIVYGVFRIAFIASFAMVLILGIGTIVLSDFQMIHAAGVMATVVLIVVAHSSNIAQFKRDRKRGA
jgi:acyl phosphate:glycerol-3-phosphate acyltransferase